MDNTKKPIHQFFFDKSEWAWFVMPFFTAEKSVSTLCKQHNVNYVTVAVSGGFFIACFT